MAVIATGHSTGDAADSIDDDDGDPDGLLAFLSAVASKMKNIVANGDDGVGDESNVTPDADACGNVADTKNADAVEDTGHRMLFVDARAGAV